MKKRIAKWMIAALLLLILPVSMLLTGLALPSIYEDTYYAVLPRMYEQLQGAQGPKIVVIGGSNVAFGLQGELLEELLAEYGYDYTVCPFGLYAAVGTSAMLDLSRDTLGEGDIVVLAMEPVSEAMSDYFGAEAFWKCAEDAPELIGKLDRAKQGTMAGNYLSYLQQRCAILTSGNPPVAEGVYADSAFNERCDLVYERPGNLMAAGFDPSVRVNLAQIRIRDTFSDQIQDYCRDAAKKGASVLLSFSPVNRSCMDILSGEAVETFFNKCNTAFSCPIISDPNRYILESGWFYDSNFHLNSAGARLRTCMLAEDLLVWLGCYEEPSFDIPVMPPSAAVIEEREGDSDCFVFSEDESGAGCRISGLTPEGLTRKELQIPSIHEGRPVLGFTGDALAEADNLEQLRIPSSVTYLPGRLFQNTKNLTRLVLEHTDVPCGIAPDTFRDADQIHIYVSADAYPLYRDGYGCETNPWTAYLDRIHTY